MGKVRDTPITNNHGGHYRLMKTCSMQLKRCNQYLSDSLETNYKRKPFIHKCCIFLMEILFSTNTCNKKHNQMQTNPDPYFQAAQFLTYYRPKWLAREQALTRVWEWVRKEGKPPGSSRELTCRPLTG